MRAHESRGRAEGEGERIFFFFFIRKILFHFLFKNLKKCLFTFERQTQNMSRGEAEREGDTESEAGSRL